MAAYDFSGVRRIVDIGGGYGGLLAQIVKAHPTIEGILCELPTLGEGARSLFEEQGVANRCAFVVEDFLAAVPPGGDVCIIMRCTRNWDNEHAVAILRNCRQGITPRGRLLVVEPVITPGQASALQLLGQLLITRAHNRIEPEHRALLAAANFELAQSHPHSRSKRA